MQMLCKCNANAMQMLNQNTMQILCKCYEKLCKVNAKVMQRLCRLFKGYANGASESFKDSNFDLMADMDMKLNP